MISNGKEVNQYPKLQKIARLIAGKIMDSLQGEEEEELSEWLHISSENQAVFDHINNSDQFRTWVDVKKSADTDAAWEKLYQLVQKENRRLMYLRIMRYAAGLFVPVVVAALLYLFIFKPGPLENLAQQEQVIRPGNSKAVLLMDDGKQVSLDSADELLLVEKDGTSIRKAEGLLNYETPGTTPPAKPLYNTISIPRGGEYNLVLSDGTRVYLNSMSELKFPVQFQGDTREVELSGEAYFEVAPAQKPFLVKSKGVVAEVLGTSFNVNAYGDKNEVVTTLVDGRIKVALDGPEGISRILEPEEQAVCVSGNRNIEVKKVDVLLYTAWKDGEINFYNERLEDIMTTLTRWYTAEVFFMNPSVKELRFSGSLDRYGDIRQILDIIRSTNKVTIEMNKTTILFREK